jgi:hypothetical protein
MILPAEHFIDDVHIAEQVVDLAMLRFALYIVEKNRTAAVQLFLNAGDFQIGINFIGDQDVAFLFIHSMAPRKSLTSSGAAPSLFCCFGHCYPPKVLSSLISIFNRADKKLRQKNANPLKNLEILRPNQEKI